MKEIPLTRGKVALVDDEDYGWLMQWKWCAHAVKGTFYAVRNSTLPTGKRATVPMHREVLGLVRGDGIQGDHADGNGLNNRKSNLRVCTTQQNNFNTRKRAKSKSRFKGVSQTSGSNTWRAKVRYNCKAIHIGCYTTQEAAARAYDEKARELFGEFAKTNF